MASRCLSKRAKRGIGRRIKEARTEAGLTRLQLARKCKIGKTQVSNYENGICTPSFAVALKLVELFGPEVFLNGGGEKDAA